MKSFVVFAIHSLLIVSNIHAAPKKALRSLDSKNPSGLYSALDGVVILTSDNFNDQVYNSGNAALVQFYDSSLEHCVKYAPMFKQMASSVQNWQDLVKIGVMDCADAQNKQMCQQHEINDYPALRYFAPELQSMSKGNPISKDFSDPAEIRAEIIRQLASSEKKMANQPDFSPLVADSEESLEEMSKNGLVVVVVEPERSQLGKELMMDLHQAKNLFVRSSNNQKLAKSNQELPQILVKKSGYPLKQLILKNANRDRAFKLVLSYMINEGHQVSDVSEIQNKHTHNEVNSEQQLAEMVSHNVKHDEQLDAILNTYKLMINALAAPYVQQEQQKE